MVNSALSALPISGGHETGRQMSAGNPRPLDDEVEARRPAQDHVRVPIPGVVYPPQADLDRYIAAECLGHQTLADGFREAARTYPDNVALVGPDLRVTYREVDTYATRLAAALLHQGLAPLDRVVFQLANSAELIYAFLACLKAGLIPICTLAAHREHEIGYLANLAEARLHLIDADTEKFDFGHFARQMQETVPSLRMILRARGEAGEGILSLHGLIESITLEEAEAVLDGVALDPFQVAVFQLSGGSTGVPKIIPRFHNEYLYNMRAVAEWMGYAQDDVLFMPQPMVHNLNMGCCFGPFLLTGGTVTIATDLQAQTLVQLIRSTRPTWLMLGGPIVARLEASLQSKEIDLSNARGVIAANSAPKLRSLLGIPVYHTFGITEGVIMFTRPGDPLEAQNTTHGRPVSDFDEVSILRPGTELPVQPGEIGEPVFRGPYTTHGYFRAEERNLETFTSDGFYRSGDLMQERRIDGTSYYVFCGRIKDVVNRAGEKINCEEVEAAIVSHPAVAAIVAVPYPDPVYEERLCAVVIPRDGYVAPTVAELGAFLQSYGMAKFKWPERVEVVTAFPLTASGKVSRRALIEQVTQSVASQQQAG